MFTWLQVHTHGPIVSVIYADKMLASYDDEFCTML